MTSANINTLPRIYFDEAGNTGDNLLDSSQPVYCLLSMSLTDHEATSLLGLIDTKANERHFKNLKKRKKGQLQILQIINDPILSPQSVKFVVAHKEYSVVAHIIDRLVEPVLYDRGHDGYRSGLFHFFANVLFAFGKSEWGKDFFSRFCSTFQRMVREKSNDSIDEFYKLVYMKLSESGSDKELLMLIMESLRQIDSILEGIQKYNLDLSLTSFSILADVWGRQLENKIDVIHDDSKQMIHFRDYISYLSSSVIPVREVGFGERTMRFPFSINTVELVNSKNSPQVQLADILVSSIGYAMTRTMTETMDNEQDVFAKEILKSRLLDIPASTIIWPSSEVSEPNFGHIAGESMLDFLAETALKNRDAFNAARPK